MKNTSKLAAHEQRLAYKLLLPTLLVLLLTALYPLGYVFYTSFTNKSFASAQPTEFVGLANYKKLLSVTIRKLDPIMDAATGEQKIDPRTGEPRFERPIRVLPRQPERYKELIQFGAAGHRYVVGATDPDFIESVFNTLLFTFLSVSLETVLGLAVALVVNTKFFGQGGMRAVMLIPWAVITVVSARMWGFMLLPNRNGFFNTVFSYLGIGDGQISFLTQGGLQLASMVAVDVWKTTSFMALLLLAGLQLIPADLYKAASVDGAGRIRQFFTITLPLLKPTLAVALIFRTLDALRVFDVFQVLLGSRVYSMASYNYEQLINYRDMGMASAIGVLIFLIIALFAISYTRMLGVETE